ncbi:M28 family peptidase [Thalassomonas actiniarum]|uniref:M28 family peptidase n=1 Tax=Thalassomonas actiniarum TaxID=485447 RepID=A0AAE9YNM3_9GAMM|nr:M28 family peptidase [Thalassomonas actiniarum]WDD96686.1 M28 family peptidase [Thalassomonas actiniarum]
MAVQLPASQALVYNQEQLLSHVQTLASDEFSGREMATLGNEKARVYIINALKQLDVAPLGQDYRQVFNHKSDVRGANVIGVIPGTEFPQQYIVLSAHFDHIGKGTRVIYNGADDNASGTAALLSIAEQVKQAPLRYSLILLFSDGEELGLVGAHAFINSYQGLLGDIKLNINLDMIAGDRGTKKLRFISKGIETLLDEQGLKRWSELRDSAEIQVKKGFKSGSSSITRGASSVNNRIRWRAASDHYVFYKAKIPFVYFGVGTHKNYHTGNDDFNGINQAFYLSATASICRQIYLLDRLMTN